MISKQFNFIWLIDRALSWVDLGAVAMKEYTAFPKAQALLEPHHQIF